MYSLTRTVHTQGVNITCHGYVGLLTMESDGLPAINGWSNVSATDDNLSFDNDMLVLGGVRAAFRSFRNVMNPVSPTYLYSRRKTEDEHGERANHRVCNCQFAFTRLPTEFRDSFLNILETRRFRIPQLSAGVTRPLGVGTATIKST